MKERLVVFSGAGVSAESGLRTFRDSDGLWESYRIEDVATPEAWAKDPQHVLRFYDQRRTQVLQAKPNAAHRAIAALEEFFEVDVITQNIDDLHERAGSTRVLHLHGEISLARSSMDPTLIVPVNGPSLRFGQQCPLGSQLRPHIVWFGEEVPMFEHRRRYHGPGSSLYRGRHFPASVPCCGLDPCTPTGLSHHAHRPCTEGLIQRTDHTDRLESDRRDGTPPTGMGNG